LRTVNEVEMLKRNILARLLVGKIDINLPPTFLNHMLNELEEYKRILSSFQTTGSFKNHILNSHYLWSVDAAGHAISIIQTLDPVEKNMMKELMKIEKSFQGCFLKTIESIGYFRSGLDNYPSINKLNKDVIDKLTIFIGMLTTIRDERLSSELLGSLNPLMADHMIREECYYLQKVYESQGKQSVLPCDPTRPRVEKL